MNSQSLLEQLLEQVRVSAKESLKQFANEPDFSDKMQLAFGDNTKFSQFKSSWQTGDFSFPQIEISEYRNGAFSEDTKMIYLEEEFLLANQSDISRIVPVLLEAYGFFIDNQINTLETSGDVGTIFSFLARGEQLNNGDLQYLKNVIVGSPKSGRNRSQNRDIGHLEVSFNSRLKLEYTSGPGDNDFVLITPTYSDLNKDDFISLEEAFQGYSDILGTYSVSAEGEFEDTETISVENEEVILDRILDVNVDGTANLSVDGGSVSFQGSAVAKNFKGYSSVEYGGGGGRGGYGEIFEYEFVAEEGLFSIATSLFADYEGSFYYDLKNEFGDSIFFGSAENSQGFNDSFELEEAGIYRLDLSFFDEGGYVNSFDEDEDYGDSYIDPNGTPRFDYSDQMQIQVDWSFTPFADLEFDFNFSNRVIEGTEGETKQIRVIRQKDDVSTTESVDIEVLSISEMEKEFANIISDLVTFTNGTETVSQSSRKFDRFLKKAIDETIDRIGDVSGEVPDSKNRISLGTKAFSILKKFFKFENVLQAADVINVAEAQARATINDISPDTFSVTFNPGDKEATVDIQLFDGRNDTEEEGDEILFLKLSQNGEDLNTPKALVAIRDDDQGTLNILGQGGLESIGIAGATGAIAGLMTGAITGGVKTGTPQGILAGAIIGAIGGGVTDASIAVMVEIAEDAVQQAIVEYFIESYGSTNNSLNPVSPNTGTNDSETFNEDETDNEINAGGGDDIVNAGAGNDTVSGGDGNDTISGGDGNDLIEGGMGADSLSGGGGSDIFGGSLKELNMDRIIDFSSKDVLQLQNTNFTQESLTVTQGSAILDIDTDLDGIIDSTITLEGDFADAEFLVEPVSIEGITETYITINDSTPIKDPEVTISDVSLAEGKDGSIDFTFDVSLSEASDETITVDYATANDSAIVGEDYLSASGTLEFASGETEKTVTVEILNDSDFEMEEAFELNLTNAVNAEIVDSQGMGIIQNEEVDSLEPALDGAAIGNLDNNDDHYTYNDRNYYFDFYAVPYDSLMNSGDTAKITVSSDDFDPILMILDGEGNVVEDNNNFSAGSTTAEVSYEIGSEPFFVSIESMGAESFGEYQLDVEVI